MIKFVDSIEKRFKDRPLTTRIVGGLVVYLLIEFVKFIISLISGLSLKPIIFWLIETKVSLSIGLLILIILASLIILYWLRLRLRSKPRSYTLSKKKDTSAFTLIKQTPSDDHFYDKVLHLNTYYYEIVFKPTDKTDYWRFGLKFSHDENITNTRYTKGNPVFHLTKWLDKKWVAATYYDENNRLWTQKDKIIIDDYQKESIRYKLYNTSEKTLIIVCDNDNRELYIHEITRYDFVKISAWGDKYDFEFDCELIEKNRK